MKTHKALILIDFLNHLQFAGGAELRPRALDAARAAVDLRARATAAGAPVIYVNDNFGDWRADRQGIYRKCMHRGCLGAPVARLMKPRQSDYFVLKPRHSGFYCTTLVPLLESLKVKKLVLTGLTADMCVLFTANDAYVRRYGLVIPRDCTAAINSQAYLGAIRYFRDSLRADTRSSHVVEF